VSRDHVDEGPVRDVWQHVELVAAVPMLTLEGRCSVSMRYFRHCTIRLCCCRQETEMKNELKNSRSRLLVSQLSEYLGLVIGTDRIQISPRKLKAIKKYLFLTIENRYRDYFDWWIFTGDSLKVFLSVQDIWENCWSRMNRLCGLMSVRRSWTILWTV